MDYPLCWSPASVLMTLSARISLGIALDFTFIVFFGASTLAASFDSTAIALTPSGETVTTRYGIPHLGGW